jgi:hypothetical protein
VIALNFGPDLVLDLLCTEGIAPAEEDVYEKCIIYIVIFHVNNIFMIVPFDSLAACLDEIWRTDGDGLAASSSVVLK